MTTTGNEARVLVSGAGGFVGSAVVRAALAAGYPVRAMVRDRARASNLAGLGVELVEADMRDRPAVDRALHGVRYFCHVAADYRLWASDPTEIMQNNLSGTATTMEAALQAGVERVVYTSSVATLALHADGRAADETEPLLEAKAIGAYKRSKVAAERLVEQMVAERGLPAVIVNPSTPIGPRDARPTPTGRIIVEAASGRIPAFVDTGLNLVHVDDVAAGHLAALTTGRVGERYILGGQNVTLATMLADIARLVGRRPPTLHLPRRMLFPLAYAAEAIARVTGKEPLLTVDGLHLARYRMFFDSAKAERELGYRPRPYGEGLHDALAWFKAARMLG
ncbi:MAG: NAD-dependent epimerase/dehydratase family protein [Pseudomonadota bacterium]|nr:NAD-dependent epimerase/dehydratase family protein [Pseudomonadota bacterium]